MMLLIVVDRTLCVDTIRKHNGRTSCTYDTKMFLHAISESRCHADEVLMGEDGQVGDDGFGIEGEVRQGLQSEVSERVGIDRDFWRWSQFVGLYGM